MPPKIDSSADARLDRLEQAQSELLRAITDLQATNEQRFREQQLASDQRLDGLAKEMRTMFEALRVAPAAPTAARPPAQIPAAPHGAGVLPLPTAFDDASGTTSESRVPPNARVDVHRAPGGFAPRRGNGDDFGFAPRRGNGDDFDERQGYRNQPDGPRMQLDRPRLPRLDLPIYDGSVDPITWLTKCDQYFRAYQIPEDDKVWMAAFHLSEVAHSWFYQLERDEGQIPWAVFKHYCAMRFGPAIRTNTLGAIKHLQQTGTLAKYQQEFTDLLCHTSGLSRTHQIELFTAGLSEPIRTHVELVGPTSLQQALNLARAYERLHPTVAHPTTTGRPTATNLAMPRDWLQPPPRAPPPTPANPAITAPNTAMAPTETRTGVFLRLSTSEMAERRQRGLCFNCDEQFVKGHRCKQLFWLEPEGDQSPDERSEDHMADELVF